jgi:hypothetical protein
VNAVRQEQVECNEAVMNWIEKHELLEQRGKIFEAGVQRADKRLGSFSFLTWSFFIAPLIACEEFFAAMFNPRRPRSRARRLFRRAQRRRRRTTIRS